MSASEPKKSLTLYTGVGCHLCDLARNILDEVLGAGSYEVVSITDNESLMVAYGERIPVVKTLSGEEKGWPFTAGQIRKIL